MASTRRPPRMHLPPPAERTPVSTPEHAVGTTSPTPPTVVDEDTNPAGPPEGTDHGHTGVGPEVAEAAVTHQAPPQPLPTEEGTRRAPVYLEQDPRVQGSLTEVGSPQARLVEYLRAHHPAEAGRMTPEGPEHPADTAVRLLTHLSARGASTARCEREYCNMPAGHASDCGWVNVG